MKTRRNHSWIAFLAVMLVIAYTLVANSVEQNGKVRKTFDGFFTAIQNKDVGMITQYYAGNEYAESFYQTLFRYDLRGWKVTSVTHQPYPMDSDNWVWVTGELYYYQLPDKLVEPTGPYKRVTNAFGPCVAVPLKMRFNYHKDSGWFIMPPHAGSGEDWPIPYEAIKHDAKQTTPQPLPKQQGM